MAAAFPSGSVITYPYLWRWQREEGRFNAPKDRPTCLAITVPDQAQGLTHLVLLAISGTPPGENQIALEIPVLELRRAGLSTLKRGWITVSEYNYDVAERSFHFDPNQTARGAFGPGFMNQIRAAIRPLFTAARGRIDRTL
ncbi:hypothetical protein PUR23_28100 [Methylorubrum populi]|jgi:hypothetical protein|nr:MULTISPECIES: hypothetical protein [Methylorubrum]MDV2986892.1 hypothetical protein [Methylobacteriaceae bacterium AG10]PZP65775.1 MAG: hypothetical protein DI590_26175 [Methylorubrum populi]